MSGQPPGPPARADFAVSRPAHLRCQSPEDSRGRSRCRPGRACAHGLLRPMPPDHATCDGGGPTSALHRHAQMMRYKVAYQGSATRTGQPTSHRSPPMHASPGLPPRSTDLGNAHLTVRVTPRIGTPQRRPLRRGRRPARSTSFAKQSATAAASPRAQPSAAIVECAELVLRHAADPASAPADPASAPADPASAPADPSASIRAVTS